METNYEVEGCWSAEKPVCRACGAKQILVPKKGHFNSKYWELKQNDGLLLYQCPNNCPVTLAEKKMSYFLNFRCYMKPNCESYNIQLDYKKFDHFILDRNGIYYPCKYEEHEIICNEIFNSTRKEIEEKGFIFTTIERGRFILYCKKEISKKQIDVLFDLIIEKRPNDFKQYIEMIVEKQFLDFVQLWGI